MIRRTGHIFIQNYIFTIALVLTMVLYFKFLFFGHISWDDPEMVFKNSAVRNFDLSELFSNHYVGNYIPITMLFHSLTWFLFENNDGAHHALNIIFHLINGFLILIIGKRLFKNELVANLGAAIFLLHPLQIESVGWIGELKNVLSTTFYLSALIAYLNYFEKKKLKYYFTTMAFFILGNLSKSSVVVFPVILICIDSFLEKKFTAKSIANKIPFLVLAVIFGFVNLKTQSADQFINYSHAFPFMQRVALAGFALIRYFILFLFPVNLSVIYPYPEIKTAVLIAGFAFLISITVTVFYLIKKKNFIGPFLILFIIVNLGLVLQFVPFGEVLYADRYMYVPIVGLAWLTAILLSRFKISFKIISIVLAFAMFAGSYIRSLSWKSAIVLYEDIIKKYPGEFVALNSAGVEYMFLNNDPKALEYLNKAVAVAPKNYKGFYNRGLLFLKNNKPELAVKSFNQTLELFNYSKAYVGRSAAYYMLKDIPKAINDANTVLQADPKNPKARFVLGNCYNDLNKLNEAVDEYNKCIEFNAEDPDFYFKRAIAYGKKQNFNQSLNDLTVCIHLNPVYFEAYYWRGVAKANLKQDPCEDLEVAARNNIRPAINALNMYCQHTEK